MEMALLCPPFADSKSDDTGLFDVLNAMAEDVDAVWQLALRTEDQQIIGMLGEPQITPAEFAKRLAGGDDASGDASTMSSAMFGIVQTTMG
eukprot:COSAG01_NODE_4684_length_4814_cov_11.714952_6_plen_91_part_00